MDSSNIGNSVNLLSNSGNFGIVGTEPSLPLIVPQIAPSLLHSFSLDSQDFKSVEYLNREIIPATEIALQQFAISPKLSEDIQQAFGYGCNLDLAHSLIDRFAKGQDLPTIQVLTQSQLGANGAFGNDTVFLSVDLLAPANKSVAVNTLLEELGHFIDSQINNSDAAGDEGAIFAKLVQGQPFQEGELAMLKGESDRRVLNIKDANGQSQSIFVEQANWNLDIDGDGKVGALSDGIMAVRYMFGSAFSGNALINGAISPTATRNLAQIQAYLQEGVTQKYLDIDGDGKIGALSDGIMAVRYMFGSAFSGNALINGAISPTATRNLASIQSYLAGLTTITPTLPTVTIATSDANATETVTSQLPDNGQFTLTRTGSLTAPLTVGYTVSGTATNGTDYTNLSGSVTFAAGAATALVDVSVIDDSIFEENETVVLTLASNAAYTLGASASAPVAIADNDVASITVTSPNGGNSLQRGQAVTIQWNDNIPDNVRVDLYKNNIFYRNITTSTLSNGSLSWTVPTDVLLGTDYKIRVAKPDNTLIDFSDNNFSITGTPNIDLKGYSLVSPVTVAAGSSQNINYNIQNAGVDPSGAFRVSFYLSSDTIFTTGDRLLGSANIASLAGGGLNGNLSRSITLPNAGDSFYSGDKTYYIGMIVDDLNAVAETNEGNNSGQRAGDDYAAVTVNGTVAPFVNHLGLITDFNKDGKTDIFWRKPQDGTNLVRLMSGGSSIGDLTIESVPDAALYPVALADFNNDGNVDILWRYHWSQNTGANQIWLMNGNQRISTVNLDSEPNNDWEVVGTGDFNSDGFVDILWRNNNSQNPQIAVWLLNSQYQRTSVLISVVPAQDNPGIEWSIKGTGDFNGDGKIDILWRNSNDGKIAVWFMDGLNRSSVALLDKKETSLDWDIVGTGDFNGDGKIDIQWRKFSTGDNAAWLMNGTTYIGALNLGVVSTDWTTIGYEKPDLIIQNPVAPSSITVGDSFTISAVTKNIGKAVSVPNHVRYWLSNDTLLDKNNDIPLVGQSTVNWLATGNITPSLDGSSQYNSLLITYDPTWGTGNKYIIFEADSYNTVFNESNESNNIISQAISITQKNSYYNDLSSLTDDDWNYQSRDNLFFDGNTQNGESLVSVKQIYSDISNAIFGSYKTMTAGNKDTTDYSGTHYGIDMGSFAGDQVKAAIGGIATLVQNISGNYFIGIKADDGNLWIYGHLENYTSGIINMRVEAGSLLGTVFDGAYLYPNTQTLWMYPHTHLEVHKGQAYNQAESMSALQAYWKWQNR